MKQLILIAFLIIAQVSIANAQDTNPTTNNHSVTSLSKINAKAGAVFQWTARVPKRNITIDQRSLSGNETIDVLVIKNKKVKVLTSLI